MIAITIKSKTYGEKLFFIDGNDLEKVLKYTWRIAKNPVNTYIRGRLKTDSSKTFLLHRVITNCPDGYVVDHINHNTFDNRKENLRICSNHQNRFNSNKYKNGKTSIYKGVYIDKRTNSICATLRYNRKHIHIGTFKTEIDAAIAYNEAALKYFGEFACLNFIPG